MKEKRKLWNKTIFWKDITRFWPLWVLGTILLQIAVTLPVFFGIKSVLANRSLATAERVQNMTIEMVSSMGAVHWASAIAVVSLIVALYIFSYLFKSRSAYAQHSLPISRVSLFLCHYSAGAVILIAPYLIAYLSLLAINQGYGLGLAPDLMLCFVETLIMILFFYSLACAVIMLVGTGPMTVAVYGVLNILYTGVSLLINNICSEFCYGFYYNEMFSLDNIFVEMLNPVLFFLNRVGINDYYFGEVVLEDLYYRGKLGINLSDFCEILLFLIPTAVLVVFALVLYKKRPIESAGNAVAFSWGKRIFRAVFTVCGSMFFANLLYAITSTDWEGTYSHQENFRTILVLMIFCAVLCYIISNMILEKTFFVWKKMSYVDMTVIVAVMIVGMFWAKNTDIWYKAPDMRKINYMELSIDQDGGSMNYYEIADKSMIKEFVKLEQEVIEAGRKENDFSHEEETIRVAYCGEDNYWYSRTYIMPIKDKTMLHIVEDFINKPDNLGRVLLGEQYDSLSPEKIEICTDAYTGGESIGKAKEEVYQALLCDIEAGNVKVEGVKENIRCYFSIRWTGERVGGGEIMTQDVVVPITNKCTNTLKVMKELKLEYY